MSKLLKVKISTPSWNHLRVGRPSLEDMLPYNKIWGNFQFEINNDECIECDYWIVYESTQIKTRVICPPQNVFLITTEEVEQRQYHPEYLKQFKNIITSREDITGDNVIKTHYMNVWFVNFNFDTLINMQPPTKNKKISVVSSNLTHLEGHKKRFAFTNKLMGHFKDRIDFYGKGFNYIKEKQEALKDYKYSVAIENASIPNYWTEKISDCFLSYTMPIYFGCPNINDFYNKDSMISIDINDWKSAINTIELLLEEDPYQNKIGDIIQARNLYLTKYQLFANIENILNTLNPTNLKYKSQNNTILPHSYFRDKSKNIYSIKDGIRSAYKIIKK